MVVDARCNDCDDNDCNNAIDCADQACSSSPFISPVCACDYGICENDEKPMWRMSGGVCGYTCYHADTCLPQSNPCAPNEYSCAALAPTCLDTSLSLSGSACCYNYAGFSASGGGPVAYCCYRGRDNDKEPCPAGGTSCSYDALGKPVLITNNGNNICDSSHGWKCDGTSQAVDCCGDTDCGYSADNVKEVCQCPDYPGTCSNYKAASDPDAYKCYKPSCSVAGCQTGYCCTDGGTNTPQTLEGACVSIGSVRTISNPKWLCAAQSPASWHTCDANAFS